MANTKNYSIRERILDKYLGSGKWYSRKQLEDFCNRELKARGEEGINSRTTIQNDFITIQNNYNIVIESQRKGRLTLYRYKNAGFSIYSSELSENDYQHLTQAMDVLAKFKGMPQFEWVDELGVRLNTSFKGDTDNKSIVSFEDATYNKGMKHFTTLFDAIKNKVAIDITYRSFKKKEAKVYSISPYYLKQYNNRWFLLGSTIGYQSIGVFPLDRIEKIENVGKTFEESDIDFNDYFDDVIGVSVPDAESQRVEVWFSKEQLNYIETKPLHGSQRVIHRDDFGGTVQYDLKINYELEQAILSFGEKTKVLAPEEFRNKIRERIAASLKNY